MAPKWALTGDSDHLVKSRGNYMSPGQFQEYSGCEEKEVESRRPFPCFVRVCLFIYHLLVGVLLSGFLLLLCQHILTCSKTRFENINAHLT